MEHSGRIFVWRRSRSGRRCRSRSPRIPSLFSPRRSRPKSGRRRWVSTEPKAGEVWFADLGMIEKSRPVLVPAMPEPRDARALAVVAPLTSRIRGRRGEVDLGKPRWLPKTSAVNVQQPVKKVRWFGLGARRRRIQGATRAHILKIRNRGAPPKASPPRPKTSRLTFLTGC